MPARASTASLPVLPPITSSRRRSQRLWTGEMDASMSAASVCVFRNEAFVSPPEAKARRSNVNAALLYVNRASRRSEVGSFEEEDDDEDEAEDGAAVSADPAADGRRSAASTSPLRSPPPVRSPLPVRSPMRLSTSDGGSPEETTAVVNWKKKRAPGSLQPLPGAELWRSPSKPKGRTSGIAELAPPTGEGTLRVATASSLRTAVKKTNPETRISSSFKL